MAPRRAIVARIPVNPGTDESSSVIGSAIASSVSSILSSVPLLTVSPGSVGSDGVISSTSVTLSPLSTVSVLFPLSTVSVLFPSSSVLEF